MHMTSIPRKWLGFSSRIALLLGLGALSTAGAKADTGQTGAGHGPTRVPQQSAKTFGDLLIWSEGGRIYVAESGKKAQELPLGDTPETRHLRLMLERDGATVDSPRPLRDRIILVGGGGEGFHWHPPSVGSRDKMEGSATRAPGKRPDSGTATPVGQPVTTEKSGVDVGATRK
jgi:hypothetical protein